MAWDTRDVMYWMLRFIWMYALVIFIFWYGGVMKDNLSSTQGMEYIVYQQRVINGISDFDYVTQRLDTTTIDPLKINEQTINSLFMGKTDFALRIILKDTNGGIIKEVYNDEGLYTKYSAFIFDENYVRNIVDKYPVRIKDGGTGIVEISLIHRI